MNPTLTNKWIVRKGVTTGTSWSTIDDYAYTGGTDNTANAIALSSSGVPYVAGYGKDASKKHWLVRTSSDSGSTWANSDDYQLTSGEDSEASSIKVASSGNIYAGGWGKTTTSGKFYWIVRSLSSGTSTWSTVDNFQYIADQHAVARGVTADASGNVFAVGYGNDASGLAHWIVRKYSCN
jgi:hypothetical protein